MNRLIALYKEKPKSFIIYFTLSIFVFFILLLSVLSFTGIYEILNYYVFLLFVYMVLSIVIGTILKKGWLYSILTFITLVCLFIILSVFYSDLYNEYLFGMFLISMVIYPVFLITSIITNIIIYSVIMKKP